MEWINALEQSPAAWVSMALIVGLMIGSFLNVVILRMPPLLEYDYKKDYAEFTEAPFDEAKPPGIAMTRSHCPQCKNQLAAWHNIPVISYLLLRGRCHFCGKGISPRYPLIELMTGLLTAWAGYRYGLSLHTLAAVLLIWMLITISWIDIDTYLIPDQLSLSLLWLGLLFSLFDFSVTPQAAIIGALVGYLSLWSVFWLFKLLAAGGAWLGAEPLIVVLLVSSVAGLLVTLLLMAFNKADKKIPFGPYLSIGILVAYLTEGSLMEVLFL
jgi:leader peptidase (prepilin peptidase)/N-methyltransferase